MEYKPINKHPSYEISREGVVRHIKTKKYVPKSKTKDRGFRVVLDDQVEYLSRLIAEAYIIKPSVEHTDVRYKDGNKNNYRFDNIEWATHSQTQYDSLEKSGWLGGNDPPKPVLDKETKITYPSIKACARGVGLAPVTIRRMIYEEERFELL